jgi:hypothetical protein
MVVGVGVGFVDPPFPMVTVPLLIPSAPQADNERSDTLVAAIVSRFE